jgi:hypothetical protein
LASDHTLIFRTVAEEDIKPDSYNAVESISILSELRKLVKATHYKFWDFHVLIKINKCILLLILTTFLLVISEYR